MPCAGVGGHREKYQVGQEAEEASEKHVQEALLWFSREGTEEAG